MIKKIKKGMLIKQTHSDYTVYLEVLSLKPDKKYINFPTNEERKESVYLVKCHIDKVREGQEDNYDCYEGEILNWYIPSDETINKSVISDKFEESSMKEIILEKI